ncbi:hypothetical protein [Sorangium sp. So ce861]|uniref:hypothetical protein n=1 Tax=Sorangium sp. So ce861 TaxID=3133323 RepID=UPI003F6447E9
MKLIDVVQQQSEVISVDRHVPLQIQWGSHASPLIHWRTGDLSRTLLEIGVDPSTGVICTLTLVLPGPVEQARAEASLAGLVAIPGIPVTNLIGTCEAYLDEPKALRVLRGRQSLMLDIGGRGTISKVMTTSRIRFGVDQHGELAAIEVFNLTPEEERVLAEGLAPMILAEATSHRVSLNTSSRTFDTKGLGMRVQWIEVWVDDSSRGDYLLVLRGLEDGRVEIVDPQKNKEQVAMFDSYDDATHWLNEEEYEPIEGRWTP